jgi:hypothetical protein
MHTTVVMTGVMNDRVNLLGFTAALCGVTASALEHEWGNIDIWSPDMGAVLRPRRSTMQSLISWLCDMWRRRIYA